MRSYTFYILLVSVLCFYSCREKSTVKSGQDTAVATITKEVRRVGAVTGLKPEKIEYYKELHANTWEGVLKKIKECNIRNYSIYIKEIGEKYYLFSYYEYIGDDYELDMKKIAADSVTQRWWRETDPCQDPLPDAAAEGKIWSSMDEVFHTE